MIDTYHLLQVAFGFSIILFWGDLKQSTGYDSGHWFWGTMLYLAVLLTVLGKAALVSECVHIIIQLCYRCSCFPIRSMWTKYTVAGTTDAPDCMRNAHQLHVPQRSRDHSLLPCFSFLFTS
jgi:hypothetical protein